MPLFLCIKELLVTSEENYFFLKTAYWGIIDKKTTTLHVECIQFDESEHMHTTVILLPQSE